MNWKSVEDLRVKLSEMLETKHPGLVTNLRVEMVGDVVVLAGDVGSEGCRADAKRLALSFEGVFKVRNDLVVAGFLLPASDGDVESYFDAPRPERRTRSFGGVRNLEFGTAPTRAMPGSAARPYRPPAVTELTEVLRQPSIRSSRVPTPGASVEIVVDLPVVETSSKAVSIGSFPADWDTIVVTTHLIAPWAQEVAAILSDVTICADGTSIAARFRCIAADNFDGKSAQVQAIFMHGTRICGQLLTDVMSNGPDEALSDGGVDDRRTPGESVPDRAEANPPSQLVRVAPEVGGPTLTVNVTSVGQEEQHWVWSFALPGGKRSGTGRVSLPGGSQAFSDLLLRACPSLEPHRFARAMDGIGEQLWRAAPAAFREDYDQRMTELDPGYPIQFNTDDPHIPWEMMKPGGAGARHLYIDHPVARWPISRSSLLRHSFESGDLLSFVPEYATHKALPAAQQEKQWLRDELGAVSMPPNRDAFFDVLDGLHSLPVAVIHFAGHGRTDTGTGDGGIEMTDGFVQVLGVDQQRVVIGGRYGTLVVLNACEASASAQMLGMNTGWGAAIAARSFGGLVAPLWEVQDDIAFEMIKVALPSLLAGRETLGAALSDARRAHHERSVAAFAYLAHGDVMARFPARR